jgi:hypothetical protein
MSKVLSTVLTELSPLHERVAALEQHVSTALQAALSTVTKPDEPSHSDVLHEAPSPVVLEETKAGGEAPITAYLAPLTQSALIRRSRSTRRVAAKSSLPLGLSSAILMASYGLGKAGGQGSASAVCASEF